MHQRIQRLWKRGEAYASSRQWEAARACFEAIIAVEPRNADAFLQLSDLHSGLGSYRKARQYLLAAHDCRPRNSATLIALVKRLRTFNEAPAILEIVRRLPALDKVPISFLLQLGSVLSYMNDQELALRFIDEAVRADPDHPPALVIRGHVLIYFGRFDDAEHDLEKCIDLAPELAQAHWLLARTRKQTPAHHHVDRLRERLQAVEPGSEAEVLLAFALHKELDDLGDYAGAWQALMRGARAKRAALSYRSVETAGLVDKLIDRCTTEFFRHDASNITGATPIFITGMHRSGTTLLERILAGHPQIVAAGELYDFTTQMRFATDYHCRGPIGATIVDRAADLDYAAIGQRYLDGIAWRIADTACFTDKLPSNFLNIGFIRRALPHAKILHMVRDPMDTCFSNLRELFSDACPYSYDQIELADYHKQYRRLMAHWHRVLPDRILDVSYADLVRDPADSARRIAAFCELDDAPQMIEIERRGGAVATASSPQIHAGIHRGGFGAWMNYRPQLEPMRIALKPSFVR